MTAPSASLPRIHLHAIPHGTALPDPSSVADGWPFLLETDGVRVLYQNFNGVWAPAVDTDPARVSPNGTRWEELPDDNGVMHNVPVAGTGPWLVVDNFNDTAGALDSEWTQLATVNVNQGATSGVFTAATATDHTEALALQALSAGHADHTVRAVLVALPAATYDCGILARGIDLHNWYSADVDSAGVLTLKKNLASTVSTEDTGGTTVVAGAVLQLSCVGNVITATATNPDGTTSTATVTDSDLNTALKVGLHMSSGKLARFAAHS